MKFFNYISINLRLFINTLLSIGFMSAIAYIGWQSLSDVQTKADALSELQKEQTSRIANLQQSLILTTQLSNEYILTRSQASNQKFNQAIDELKVQTEQMLNVLTSPENQEVIHTIETVLRQYKKVTNSNVFLKTKSTIPWNMALHQPPKPWKTHSKPSATVLRFKTRRPCYPPSRTCKNAWPTRN